VQHQIEKIIDRACNQLSVENADIRIPLLEIDLGRISFDKLEEEIVLAFEKRFYEKLSEHKNYLPGRDMVLFAKDKSSFEIIRFFLLTGCLPWFAGKQDENYLADLFDEVFARPNDALRRFILLNLHNERFIERLTARAGALHIDRIIRLIDLDAELVINMETIIRNIVEEIILLVQSTADNSKGENGAVSLQERNIEKAGETVNLLIRFLEDNKGSYALHLRKTALEFILKLISVKNDISTAGQFYEVFEKILAERFEFSREVLYSIEFILKLIPGKNDISMAGQFYEAFEKILVGKSEFSRAILHSLSLKDRYTKDLPAAINQAKTKLEENRVIPGEELPETVEIGEEVKFYISNAGLVLLANYFPVFFNELKLLDQGDFTNKNNQVKAVFLLHYLCTGREEAPEYILPLNKILCGLSLDEPLPSSVLLSENEKNECEELLTGMIRNWQKIGNSSIEGLQEAFLNREGILTQESNGWKLQVERRGHDVLLDSLPWSFNHIKLSWMQNLITTEW